MVKISRRVLVFAAGLVVVAATHVSAKETRAVIDDPDGFTNVRVEPNAKSAVVAKVKRGEVFTFTFEPSSQGVEWCAVTLASGKKGYMHADRVFLHSTMAELASRKPDDEITEKAARRLFDYLALARAAARGERAAMRTYFALQRDGEEGEMHAFYEVVVIHILGDEKLAAFLRQQSTDYRATAREVWGLISGLGMIGGPMEEGAYLRRHFPKTVAALDLQTRE
ncbi:MAG TPA: SH3 domain-containing protein [Chthoniobacterales bacterium]|nr:SH3 domain-containing protein [Chthoniobacterales bacterium]